MGLNLLFFHDIALKLNVIPPTNNWVSIVTIKKGVPIIIINIKSDFIEKIKILKKHNNLYYNNDKPIISDFEYDRIKNEILGLEKKHNFLRKLNIHMLM